MKYRRASIMIAALLTAALGISMLAGCGETKVVVETVPSTETPAQSATTPTDSGQQAQVTGEPDKVVTQYVDAVNRGDLNAAQNLWSGNTGEAADWFDRSGITVNQIQVTGSGQTANVTGTVTYTDDDGEIETDDFRFTLNKVGDAWKIVDED